MGLDTVELALAFEEKYSIVMSDAGAAARGAVCDLVRYIVREFAALCADTLTCEVVLLDVIDLLVSRFAVPRQSISSASHVVRDESRLNEASFSA